MRAYIAKWGKTILFSFIAGLAVFFIILFSSRFFINLVPIYNHKIVGVTGAYTLDNLPYFITEELSDGLTKIDENGSIKPALAKDWKILDKGKTYVFNLKNDKFLSDGRNISSDLINYNFSDVTIERPDKYTVVFKLKDIYAPFLITVSRPIFQPGLIGGGEYKIEDIELNGNFVQSLTLTSVKNKFDIKTYEFYPSPEALKYAFAMGEVTQAIGLDSIIFNDISFENFNNAKVEKKINYKKLVTLFYNNNDPALSDKKVRLGLSYALPGKYNEGEAAFLPYPPNSIYFNKDLENKIQNFEHANLLLSAALTASDSAEVSPDMEVTIKSLPKYKKIADDLAKNFGKAGVTAAVEEVDKVPANFQLYLGDFSLSNDPDQYSLWHSGQVKNITRYKNLRIDKLLEDGRKTLDVNSRKAIYDDFQKFLIEDVPASFLYFPFEYEVVRK
jgi:ABC-type transport system substrate-binding protein